MGKRKAMTLGILYAIGGLSFTLLGYWYFQQSMKLIGASFRDPMKIGQVGPDEKIYLFNGKPITKKEFEDLLREERSRIPQTHTRLMEINDLQCGNILEGMRLIEVGHHFVPDNGGSHCRCKQCGVTYKWPVRQENFRYCVFQGPYIAPLSVESAPSVEDEDWH